MKKPSIKLSSTHLIFVCSDLPLNTMSFVLFWRRIVRSERCSSCLPLTIKLHFPSSTLPPSSALSSSSSSSHFTPPLNVISDFLTKECGFSSSQVTTVMRLKPELLRRKSDQNAREAIHLLKDYGLTENKLKSTILKAPGILKIKADMQLKPKVEFLKKMGLASQDIVHIIFHRPRLLELSLPNCLAPRFLQLETLFISKVHLCKVLRRVPWLLTTDFEKQVIPKVEYLKNSIGIPEDSPTFVRALDVVARLSFETLVKKTKHLASLGLPEEEIGLILKRHPDVLRNSTEKTTGSFNFLIRTAGIEPKIVALYPSILNLSVEKRLKPRYEVFKSLSTSPHAKGLPSLVRFFRLSEQEFLKRFGQYCTTSSPTIIQSPKANILEQ